MLSHPLIRAPLENPRIWVSLGWLEIRQSYRRTLLGPLWISLNMIIFATALTVVYGAIFGLRTADYASYMICGMTTWFWISGLLTDGGNSFKVASQYIRGTPIDKAYFVWATAFKHIIILAHNLVVYLGILVIGIVKPTFYILLAIPSILTLFLLSIPLIGVLSILYVRFQDLQRLVSSSIIIIMLCTPIFWKTDMVQGWRNAFYLLNPVYYLIEVLRAPLLGNPLDPLVFAVVLAMLIMTWIVGGWFYAKYQHAVIFWL